MYCQLSLKIKDFCLLQIEGQEGGKWKRGYGDGGGERIEKNEKEEEKEQKEKEEMEMKLEEKEEEEEEKKVMEMNTKEEDEERVKWEEMQMEEKKEEKQVIWTQTFPVLSQLVPLCCAKMNFTGVKRIHRERATAAISILLTGLVVDE